MAHEGVTIWLGIDWADQRHRWAMRIEGESRIEQGELEHTPEAVEQFVSGLAFRFPGQRVAVALEQSRGRKERSDRCGLDSRFFVQASGTPASFPAGHRRNPRAPAPGRSPARGRRRQNALRQPIELSTQTVFPANPGLVLQCGKRSGWAVASEVAHTLRPAGGAGFQGRRLSKQASHPGLADRGSAAAHQTGSPRDQ